MFKDKRRSRVAWAALPAAAAVATVALVAPQFGGTSKAASNADPAGAAQYYSETVVHGHDYGFGDHDDLESETGISTPDDVTTSSTGTLSAAASKQYSIMKATLNSGKKINARWNPCQTVITYRVNLSGLPKKKRAAMLKTIKASVKKLSTTTGMKYRYKGGTTFVPKQNNLTKQPAEIVIAAVPRKRTDFPMDSLSLGYGGVIWNTWYGSREGAAVTRGFVVLEANEIQKLKTGFGKGLRQSNVILHELGHATGLNHVKSKKQLMYPTMDTWTPSGFASGDKAGLKKVGKKAGCINIPKGVALKDLS